MFHSFSFNRSQTPIALTFSILLAKYTEQLHLIHDKHLSAAKVNVPFDILALLLFPI